MVLTQLLNDMVLRLSTARREGIRQQLRDDEDVHGRVRLRGFGLAEGCFPLAAIVQILGTFSENFGGHAAHDGEGSHVLRDDGTGTDNGALADGDALEQGGVGANPSVVFDDDGTEDAQKLWRLHVVATREERYAVGDAHAVADGDASTGVESATAVDVAVCANAYPIGTLEVAGLHNESASSDFRAEELEVLLA